MDVVCGPDAYRDLPRLLAVATSKQAGGSNIPPLPHSSPTPPPNLSKTQIVEMEKVVDVVCGPDAYRDLSRLLAVTNSKQAGGSNIFPNAHKHTYKNVYTLYNN